MSEDLGTGGDEFFGLAFENDGDSQSQPLASFGDLSGSPSHDANDKLQDMGDDESDWFGLVDRNLSLHDGPEIISHTSPGRAQREEEDWFSNEYTSSSGASSGFGYLTLTSSVLDTAVLSTRNGNSHRVMTTLSGLTSILASMGVDGPRHMVAGSLNRLGTEIGRGAQFTVFVNGIDETVVLKRINHYNAPATLSKPEQTRTYFRTLELEILALCHPPLREHRNIVDLLAWGYDYQTPEIQIPVLIMERAITSLSEFLLRNTMESMPENRQIDIKHQLCLDIADGLEALHKEGIVHGDVKPDNVLVFSQKNPRAPYLCKLSDFGVCISMESPSSLSFASYRGTPGWAPPEVEVDAYDKGKHGDFSPELLFKCDGFSYCLVVLSTLFTRGRLPFQTQGGEDEDPLSEKAMGLIFEHESPTFPKSLRSKLLSLCNAMLKQRPRDRTDVSYNLLADFGQGYNDWITAREEAGKQKRGHIPGRKMNDTNKGITYWMGLQPTALKQLAQDFEDSKNDTGPQFPSDTLFGMAIGSTSSRSPGFEQRVVEYIGEAAISSCIPAQAIVKRLYKAHGQSISTIADEKLLETWLYNSVSTGSFIAAEDLAELNPTLLRKAQAEFRKAGGYNAEVSQELTHQFLNLDIDMARLACESGVESLQDLNGNRLIHFAAMFNKPDVIRYLVEERRALVNSQNDKGETPLNKACQAGHHAAVEMLISLGADASITSTRFRVSPLHWLFNFEEQHIDRIAKILVFKGKADIDAIVSSDKVGASEQHMPFLHFPFHWPFGTPIHWAASVRCTAAIDSLLNLGADINYPDSKTDRSAQSALAMAARRCDSKIVKYLLSKGASATVVSGQGHSPFHMMALTYGECNRVYRLWEGLNDWIYNGTFEDHLSEVRKCILALSKAGCDLNGRRSGPGSKPGSTPLLDAANAENCVVSLALLEAGANADCDDYACRPAVYRWACSDPKLQAYPQGFPVLFGKLIDSMNDINAGAGFFGESVVHYASRSPRSLKKREFEERIRFLVNHDPPADINALDEQGISPLLSSIANLGPGEALMRSKVLLRHGARIHYTPGDKDFLFILCHNSIMTDAETVYLLRVFLEDYSHTEKVHMITSSVGRVFGREVRTLYSAIKEGKFECVKYFLELGIDPNMILDGQYRATPLDWALRSGERIRRSYLETLTVYFIASERDAASQRGVVFGLKFREDNTVFGDEGISRESYFGIIKIITYLFSIGAKQARHLIKDGYRPSNPASVWDNKFAKETNGWYKVETQPFYEHWKLMYSLRYS